MLKSGYAQPFESKTREQLEARVNAELHPSTSRFECRTLTCDPKPTEWQVITSEYTKSVAFDKVGEP